MLNSRERFSLALLGLFLLAGMGVISWKSYLDKSDGISAVTPPQAEQWNQQLAEARAVDVNTATKAELERLPGIGPALASRIVQDRNQRGPFSSVHDIMRVEGVGEKLYAALSPRLRTTQENF